MNDTPRTNAILTSILDTSGHVGFINCPPAWVAWARELERELNAANAHIKRLEEFPMECVEHLAKKSCGCQHNAPESERNSHWPSCMIGRAQEWLGRKVSWEINGKSKEAKP